MRGQEYESPPVSSGFPTLPGCPGMDKPVHLPPGHTPSPPTRLLHLSWPGDPAQQPFGHFFPRVSFPGSRTL